MRQFPTVLAHPVLAHPHNHQDLFSSTLKVNTLLTNSHWRSKIYLLYPRLRNYTFACNARGLITRRVMQQTNTINWPWL
jgi:hypothetical protein